MPCSYCIKRGCRNLCPDAVLPPKNAVCVSILEPCRLRSLVDARRSLSYSKSSTYETLQNRTLALEDLLKQHGIAVPETPASNSPLFSSLEGKAALQTTSAIPNEDSNNDDGWLPALGTLELGGHGRARFVGSNAASEWTADVSREFYAVSSALLQTSAVES